MSNKLEGRTSAGWGPMNFVLHSILSTLVANLVGIVLVVAVALLTASVTRNVSRGNFVDHVAAQPIFFLLNPPYFVAPIVIGFATGILARRWLRSNSGQFVWIIPALILVWNLLTWQSGGRMPVNS